ncbi:tetratricopeptide repeat protein [Fretibacter rubidus]|uniref:tetratricopeptide repeat protein n=1 Tax=Fretibacter rubidus TaxID=570162 RepID=UPI00352A7AED
MVDFINEVEEELRKDEYNRLLKKFGPLIVAVIVAIIAATGYMEWQKSSADRMARAVSVAYVQAGEKANAGNTQGAIVDFIAISEKSPAGYAGLSLMRAAALELEAGNRDRAVSLFDQAASVFEKPRHKQLAQLKAGYILAGDGRYDDVRSRMAPLAAQDQPYEDLARELLGFAAMRSGDMGAAREQFSYLDSIPGVLDTVQARASQYLSLMKTDDAAKAPAPTDTTVTPPTEETSTSNEGDQ